MLNDPGDWKFQQSTSRHCLKYLLQRGKRDVIGFCARAHILGVDPLMTSYISVLEPSLSEWHRSGDDLMNSLSELNDRRLSGSRGFLIKLVILFEGLRGDPDRFLVCCDHQITTFHEPWLNTNTYMWYYAYSLLPELNLMSEFRYFISECNNWHLFLKISLWVPFEFLNLPQMSSFPCPQFYIMCNRRAVINKGLFWRHIDH